MELLLNHGAQVNFLVHSQYRVRETPLTAAIFNKNDKIVRLLLERGANPNLHDHDAFPLHKSCSSQRKKIVRMLISYDADINRARKGSSGGSNNCLFGYLRNTRGRARKGIVKCLLTAGIDVDCTDGRGQTSLMLSAIMGNIPIMQLLLDRNANIEHTDFEGQTALFLAVATSQVRFFFFSALPSVQS